MRQSRAEERILGGKGGNAAHPAMGNAQEPGGQQPSWNNRTFRRGWVPRGGWQNQRGVMPRLTGGERGLGAMVVDREGWKEIKSVLIVESLDTWHKTVQQEGQ